LKASFTASLPRLSPQSVVQIGLMAALTAVGAYLKIPLPHVPITLQMTFVGLAGIWLGPWRGAASQIIYLCVGLVGLPVFAKGGGPHYVFEPSFGFLLGFVPGALITGFIGRRTASYYGTLVAIYAGVIIVYAVGVPYFFFILAVVLDAPLSTEMTTGLVLLPLPKDLIVGLGTAFLAWRLQPVFDRGRRSPR
jgi:biotin transport system substrate-specific component